MPPKSVVRFVERYCELTGCSADQKAVVCPQGHACEDVPLWLESASARVDFGLRTHTVRTEVVRTVGVSDENGSVCAREQR